MQTNTYRLDLYYKQGDDFAHISKDRTPADALKAWGEFLESCAQKCSALSTSLHGHKIRSIADTNYVAFEPLTQEAEKALDALVALEILSKESSEE